MQPIITKTRAIVKKNKSTVKPKIKQLCLKATFLIHFSYNQTPNKANFWADFDHIDMI